MTNTRSGRTASPVPESISPPGENKTGLMGMLDLEILLSRLQQAIAHTHEVMESAWYKLGIALTFCLISSFFVILGLSVDTALVYQVTASSWRDLAGNIPNSALFHVVLSSAQGVVAVLGLHFVFKYLSRGQIRVLILMMAGLIAVFVSCLGITAADLEWTAFQDRQGESSSNGLLLDTPAPEQSAKQTGLAVYLAFWGLKISPFLILPIVTVLFLEIAIANFKSFYIAAAEWSRVSKKIESLNKRLEACYTMKGSLEVAKTQLGFDLFYMKSCTDTSDNSTPNQSQ